MNYLKFRGTYKLQNPATSTKFHYYLLYLPASRYLGTSKWQPLAGNKFTVVLNSLPGLCLFLRE
jgi:hypothetical protein